MAKARATSSSTQALPSSPLAMSTSASSMISPVYVIQPLLMVYDLGSFCGFLEAYHALRKISEYQSQWFHKETRRWKNNTEQQAQSLVKLGEGRTDFEGTSTYSGSVCDEKGEARHEYIETSNAEHPADMADGGCPSEEWDGLTILEWRRSVESGLSVKSVDDIIDEEAGERR